MNLFRFFFPVDKCHSPQLRAFTLIFSLFRILLIVNVPLQIPIEKEPLHMVGEATEGIREGYDVYLGDLQRFKQYLPVSSIEEDRCVGGKLTRKVVRVRFAT